MDCHFTTWIRFLGTFQCKSFVWKIFIQNLILLTDFCLLLVFIIPRKLHIVCLLCVYFVQELHKMTTSAIHLLLDHLQNLTCSVQNVFWMWHVIMYKPNCRFQIMELCIRCILHWQQRVYLCEFFGEWKICYICTTWNTLYSVWLIYFVLVPFLSHDNFWLLLNISLLPFARSWPLLKKYRIHSKHKLNHKRFTLNWKRKQIVDRIHVIFVINLLRIYRDIKK